MISRERGRAGLREFLGRVTNWRIGPLWYLVIALLPLIWHGILPGVGLYALRYGSAPEISSPARGAPPWRDAWWFFFYVLLIGGGQEELGWRGYALPKLQETHGALTSSLIVGVVWSVWHLPMLFIPGSSLDGVPFPIYLVLLTAQAIVYTWLYNGTGSVFACILYHTWSNLAAVYLMVEMADPVFGLITLGVQLAVVILLLVLFGPGRLARTQVDERAV
jgi:membrane protease YdiL (CAAX protease family)